MNLTPCVMWIIGTSRALGSGLTGLLALNSTKDQRTVIVLARGNDVAINAFNVAIHDDKPPEACLLACGP